MADFSTTTATTLAPIPNFNPIVPQADMLNALNVLINSINKTMGGGMIVGPTYLIANLPSSGLTIGQRAFVSNGLLATGWGVVPGATGAVTLPVFADTATTWKYG